MIGVVIVYIICTKLILVAIKIHGIIRLSLPSEVTYKRKEGSNRSKSKGRKSSKSSKNVGNESPLAVKPPS